MIPVPFLRLRIEVTGAGCAARPARQKNNLAPRARGARLFFFDGGGRAAGDTPPAEESPAGAYSPAVAIASRSASVYCGARVSTNVTVR